jgi:hypothetical protein
MNQRNQKKPVLQVNASKKRCFFLVIFWSFLVKKVRNFLRFTSLIFANLRFWENKALFYKLFKLRTKRLRKYGVGGIRTLGTL